MRAKPCRSPLMCVLFRSAHGNAELILWHLRQIVISQLKRKCRFGPSKVLKATRENVYASTQKSKMRKNFNTKIPTIHCGCGGRWGKGLETHLLIVLCYCRFVSLLTTRLKVPFKQHKYIFNSIGGILKQFIQKNS